MTSAFSPHGPSGQKYLASSIHVSMPLWENEAPGKAKPERLDLMKTEGYVLKRPPELRIEGQTVPLDAGDSWAVPKGARYGYKILEAFTAVEATSSPAQVHEHES